MTRLIKDLVHLEIAIKIMLLASDEKDIEHPTCLDSYAAFLQTGKRDEDLSPISAIHVIYALAAVSYPVPNVVERIAQEFCATLRR
jgi:hypothetical protein